MSDSLTKDTENQLSRNFTIRSLIQFALPTIVMMVFMGVYTIGDTIIISQYVNTNALSALNIVTPVINVIVGLGAMLATGGSVIVARKVYRICLIFISIVSVAIFVVNILLSVPLVSIFTPKGTHVYEIAQQGFMIFSISFLFCGLNIFASASFSALSNGKVSVIISTLRTFIFISIALLILLQIFDVTGIWIAVPLAELLTAIVLFVFIFKNTSVYYYL